MQTPSFQEKAAHEEGAQAELNLLKLAQDAGRQAQFISHAERAGEEILSWKRVVVAHHHDCDGIASAGVAVNALRNSGIPFETIVLKRLDEPGVRLVAQKAEEFTGGAASADGESASIVFSDLGSGQLALLEPLLSKFKLAVIDHHVLQKQLQHENLLQVNPELFGLDGGVTASAASTAYFVFRKHCPGLAPLAIVGACGDMQDNGSSGFVGLNRQVLEEGVESGFVNLKRDLKMYGRHSRSLVYFLSYSTEPFLQGLSGDPKACAAFLEENGIPYLREGVWLRYRDLNELEKKKLVSALAVYLTKKGAEKQVVFSLIGDVYEFPREPEESELFDSSEFSTLLNAVGRHGKAQLGISVCLKEPGAFEQARSVLEAHRRAIAQGIDYAKQNFEDLDAFYFVDARGVIEDTIIGSVIGNFFGSGLVARTKPIVGFSIEPETGFTKASGRGSKQLVEKGLDLNLALRGAAEPIGGLGGGHKIASGASFPSSKEKEFLFKLRETLKAQLQLE